MLRQLYPPKIFAPPSPAAEFLLTLSVHAHA